MRRLLPSSCLWLGADAGIDTEIHAIRSHCSRYTLLLLVETAFLLDHAASTSDSFAACQKLPERVSTTQAGHSEALPSALFACVP